MPRVPVANEVVFDRGVRHAMRLGRFTTRETNQLLHFLNGQVLPKAERTLRDRLARARALGGDPGEWTTQRVKNVISGVNGVIGGGLREAGSALREDLAEMGISEAAWQKAVISNAVPDGIEIDLELPSISQINKIIATKPFKGKVLSEWWGKINGASRTAVDSAIKLGLASGETTAQIVRRLAGTEGGRYMDGVFGGLRRNVASTTQTAITHVSTRAREATYKANDDIVKGVEIVATLDSRTTEICMSEDGKVYPVDSGPRPPFHWNCRSTTVPVLKSWKELGLKEPEKIPAGTRASMTGQVPARQTYQGWLKKQPKRIQVEALGKEKAKLFRSGRITVKDFVDDKRRMLTLAEIKLREELDDFAVMAAKLSPAETTKLTKSLLRELELAGPADSKRIRGKLRRLGHKGGLKGKVPPRAPRAPKLKPTPLPVPTPVRPREVMSLSQSSKKLSQTLRDVTVRTPSKVSYAMRTDMTTINRELDYMIATNPNLAKMLKSRWFPLRQIEFLNVKTIPGRNATGLYQGLKQKLTVVKGWKPYTNKVSLGVWNIADSQLPNVFRHEFGHSVGTRFGLGIKTKQGSWREIFRRHNRSWWETNVSKYAASADSEAFAESFSYYTHPSYGVGRRLPKEIERYFDEVLKGAGGRRKAAQLAATGTRDLGQFDVFAAALSPTEQKSLVSDLLVQLRDAGKGQAKSIRAKLRRLGHTGGLGGAKAIPPLAPTIPTEIPSVVRELRTRKDANKWVRKAYHDTTLKMTQLQEDSLIQYKGMMFSDMNSLLRTGKFDLFDEPFHSSIQRDIRRWTKGLTSLFKRAPRTPAPITVFRGIELTVKQQEILLRSIGKSVTEKGFMSTTLARDISEKFAKQIRGTGGPRGVILKIRVPQGTRSIPPGALLKEGFKSVAARDVEMLFPPGTRLKLIRLVRKRQIPIIEVEMIPPRL